MSAAFARTLLRTFADLALGAGCACCGAATRGEPLCARCGAGLVGLRAHPVTGWAAAAAPYRGEVATLVNAWKERGVLAAGTLLADLLADAVESSAVGEGPLELVAVPSRPAAVRRRGRDTTADLAARAARVLRARGRTARAVPRLRLARAVADQHGLGRTERAANLAGAMRVARTSARADGVVRVVVDDVVTTGATLTEATRALRGAGLAVDGAAVVAATVRSLRSRQTRAVGPSRPG